MRRSAEPTRDELRPEYDFSTLKGGVPGKYCKRAVAGTTRVLLDADVTRIYPDAKSVNQTLRRAESRAHDLRLLRIVGEGAIFGFAQQ